MPTRPPAGDAASRVRPGSAEALERRKEEVVSATVDALYERHPDWLERWGDEGRAQTRTDNGYHVDHLVGSLELGDARMFVAYTRWLCTVLVARRVPREAVVENYEVLGEVLRARLGPDAAPAAVDLLERGREVAASFTLAEVGAPGSPVVDQLARALVDGDRALVNLLIEDVIRAGGSFEDVADRLVAPTMRHVGRLWEANAITPAEEHRATSLVTTAFGRAFYRAQLARRIGRRAMFACVEGNTHALGLLLLADAFESRGWDVEVLGADVPARGLAQLVARSRPDVLCISLSMPWHVPVARRTVDLVRERSGEGAPRILVGGRILVEYPEAWTRTGADGWAATAADAVAQAEREVRP